MKKTFFRTIKLLFVSALAIALLFSLAACTEEEVDDSDSDIVDTFDDLVVIYSKIIPKEVSDYQHDEELRAIAKNPSTGLYGFINTKGEWVLSAKYKYLLPYSGESSATVNNYGFYEVINKDGTSVYSSYRRYTWDTTTVAVSKVNQMRDDRMLLTLNTGYDQKYIYLNTDYSFAFTAWDFPCTNWYSNYLFFGFATDFNNGEAVVMRMKNTSGYTAESAYVIDTDGNILATLPAGLDADESGIDDVGNIIVKNTDGLYGLCSKDGELLIECSYKQMRHCSGSYYLVCKDDGFYSFINQDNEPLNDENYIKAMPFSNGLAAVYNGTAWAFIDESGEPFCDYIFDDVAELGASNPDVASTKAAFSEGYAAVKYNGYWVVIDMNMNVITSMNSDAQLYIDGCPYKAISNGIIVYRKYDGESVKYGALTTKNEILIPLGTIEFGAFSK